MTASQWVVEPLGKTHDRSAFTCGNEVLDRYLKEIARQDARRRVAAPFVLVAEAAPRTILGYYRLSSYGIDLANLPMDVVKKLPVYPVVPGTLLGRLAIDQRYHRQGLGEFLLMDALRRAFEHSSHIASFAVVVDAIDEPAIRFYEHFDFIAFRDKPNRLFLPMKTIAVLFES